MPKFDLALKDGAVSPIKFLSNHSLSQEKRAVTALAAGEDNIILLNTCQPNKLKINIKIKGEGRWIQKKEVEEVERKENIRRGKWGGGEGNRKRRRVKEDRGGS